eukprot:Clim_evm22s236 gene=Clim_evmTU22s236
MSFSRLLSTGLCTIQQTQLRLGASLLPTISLRCASKKAGGITKNTRKSAGKRLGWKVMPGALVTVGNIIRKQRGMEFHPGGNVGVGKDFTLFAKAPGVVKVRDESVRQLGTRRVVYVAPAQDFNPLYRMVQEQKPWRPEGYPI